MTNGVRREFPRILERVRVREKPKARKQNAIVDALNRRTEGVDLFPTQRPNSRLAPSAVELGRFRIKSVESDYLICREWNGVAEGESDVFVAKPYILRESLTEHAGFTFTYSGTKRIADDGSETETQVVIPAYAVEDEILAVRGIARGTGARADSDARIEWFDVNVDGRMWAREAE